MAAALLFLGVAAGIANLNIRFDTQGITIRTGWSPQSVPAFAALAHASSTPAGRSAPAAASAEIAGPLGSVPAPASGTQPPWRADLAALEQQLRNEFHVSAFASQVPAAARSTATASGTADAEMMRRVHALISQSEQRQQRELALRLAGVMRDVDVQRRADLVRIDRSLGLMQNNTGVEVMKQRELLNYLVRVSQKQ